jgi:3,4-dihydroxy 2-butanone 4-phosphate synthase/GTP cyclohydrolase II
MKSDYEIDDELRAALRAEDAELLARIEQDPGIRDVLREGFRGRMAWWMFLVSAVHLALVRGSIDSKEPTLVRVHRQDTLSDVLGLHDGALHRPLRDALALIATEGCGVAVILRPEESARDLMHAVQALGRSKGPEVGARQERRMDFRTFGVGAQILRALGVRRMRVIGAPKHMHALSGFGLEVVEYVTDAADQEDSHG